MPCESCTSQAPIKRYRGHYLCEGCVLNWSRSEAAAHIAITWEQFLNPSAIYAFPAGGVYTLKSRLVKMPVIDFRKGILRAAVEKLKQHYVTQTIRSKNYPLIEIFRNNGLNNGSQVQILLDNELIGFGEVLTVEESPWATLTADDARLGGFANKRYLKAALTRAGFRFKPLEDYSLWRVGWKWL